MFKDARALDRQRTATSFDRALSAYTKTAESWFDGTVQSVDRRLAQCDRLLHTARATVARMTISDSNRYLAAAERLSDDRRVLEGLRDDLLTGASNREDVTGPPGWKPRHATDTFIPGNKHVRRERPSWEPPAHELGEPDWVPLQQKVRGDFREEMDALEDAATDPSAPGFRQHGGRR